MQTRVRRHVVDQCHSLMWAIDRMINSKGVNKDFVHLDGDTQKLFLELLKVMEITNTSYESWLWDKAEKVDQSGGDVHEFLPKHMSCKVKAVQDFVATLPPHPAAEKGKGSLYKNAAKSV